LGGLLPGVGDQLERRFGSSEYAKTILGRTWGLPPALDLDLEKRLQAATREIARAGLAESLHDLSDGGLAVAAAECCFGPGRIGAVLEITTDLPAVFTLFHEAPSRVLLSVAEENLEAVARSAASHRVEALTLGRTAADRLELRFNGSAMFSTAVDDLFRAWDTALEGMLEK
jgi:phosphoribosylformylglycinamidine synthase